MKIYKDIEQLTPEWFAVKCGKVSASHMSAVMAKGKGKTRHSYMMKLLAERLSGITQESYSNGSMQWGIDTEPQAREAYEMANLVKVEQVGFVEINDYLGYSPDGFVGTDGGLEIKCPDSATHLKYILENRMVTDYSRQVQSTLWMSKREWWDFVSFDPRIQLKPIWSIRVQRDEAKIKEIAIETELFIDELKELLTKIKGE